MSSIIRRRSGVMASLLVRGATDDARLALRATNAGKSLAGQRGRRARPPRSGLVQSCIILTGAPIHTGRAAILPRARQAVNAGWRDVARPAAVTLNRRGRARRHESRRADGAGVRRITPERAPHIVWCRQ